jgi:phosphatidylserine decarboxylase
MRIAPEGYPFIGATLVLALGLWTGAWLGVGGSEGSGWVAIQLGAWTLTIASCFVLWFFRDPTPAVPTDAEVVVAPGQGQVVQVEDVHEEDYLRGPATKISIFLSVFDVHVQRAPVSGRVEYKDYRPGAYAVAWATKASEDNERSSLGIAAEHGRVLVRQIAGLVARRIVTDPDEGHSVVRGRRVGIIRFGSRVDLFLPAHWEVLCAVGDRVRVGSSVVARQREEAA